MAGITSFPNTKSGRPIFMFVCLLYTLNEKKNNTHNQHKHTMSHTVHQLIIYINTIIYIHTENTHVFWFETQCN